MSTVDARKDLIRYLLGQVKNKALDVDVARQYIASLTAAVPVADDPVAVVGIACRFPEAGDKDAFWANLVEGRESIGEFPALRLEDYRRIEPGDQALRRGGYLDRIDLFDAELFGLPPQVALQMDPYHRLLLEVLVETGEDAGYPRSVLYGSNTGIFVGNDHTHRLNRSYLPFLADVDFSAITGSWSSILASRLSYLFNLRGPASVIDTGCSSGLVALDAATKALRAGDCDAAFVAAINLFLDPTSFGDETSSPQFRVRPFDDAADGTVWSEGVAGILIKPLSRAVSDGDHIYGVVRAVATNSDGRSNGLTAPNAQAQSELLSRAWRRAGIAPETLSYLESHGTGTVLGDPIEVKGLVSAFAQFTDRRQFCAMGSVKSNIGHTVGAAGLASLVKVLLCLEHGVLPPSLNFEVPNRFVDLVESPVYIADRALDWPRSDVPRRAGVSSFSLGGTNAHVVVEEAPLADRAPAAERALAADGVRVYPLSARTEELLAASAADHADRVGADLLLDLDDACFTLQACRDHQPVRSAVVFRGRTGLLAGLAALAAPTSGSAARGEGWSLVLADDPGPDAEVLRIGLDAARAFVAGEKGAFAGVPRPAGVRRVPLPGQPLDRRRFWDETPRAAIASSRATVEDPIARLREAMDGPSRVTGEDAPSAPRRLASIVWTEVLGYPQVAADDDFFRLGGDSISSMRMAQLLGDVVGLSVPGTVLLERPTFDAFAAVLEDEYGLTAERVDAVVASGPREERRVEERAYELPLTPAQRSVFLAVGIEPDSVAYNVTGITLGEGRVAPARLRAGLAALVERHDSLRTTFHLVDDQPVQRIHAEVPTDVRVIDLPAPAPGVSHEDAARAALDGFVQPFDLGAGPLFRVAHLQFEDGVSCTAVDVHHLVTDGTSMGILMRDFAALSAGEALPPLALGYRGAVEELLARAGTSAMAEHRQYWLERFSDEPPVLRLNIDGARPAVAGGPGATLFSELDGSVLAQAKAFAQRHGMTLNMLLLGTYHLLLARMSGQRDIVIGTPVLGRSDPGFRDLVGMFVNTLPVRLSTAGSPTVADYLAGLRSTVVDALAHQDFPFESLVEAVNPPREPGRRALVDVYFAHQNSDMGLDHDGERALTFDAGTAKFDLTLTTREARGRLLLSWEYATELFHADTVGLHAERFTQLLASITAADAGDPVDGLALIGAEEERLLQACSRPEDDRLEEDRFEDDPFEESGLVALFERVVRERPEAVALVQGDERLTYAALDARANRIARGLVGTGLAGGPVALLLDRSFELVAAMLGVLKSGSHYVPLNTEFPGERIGAMLDDSASPLLLTSDTRLEQARGFASERLHVLTVDACARAADDDGPLGLPSRAEDPVYVMYTSGTTGRPKGSLIRQRGVLRVAWHANFYDAGPDDVFVMLSDYSFDGSVFDMFSALLNGGRLLVLEPEVVQDLDRLARQVRDHGVTCFFVTTGLFNALVDHNLDAFAGVRRVIFGGEVASQAHVRRAFEALGPGRVAQAYGPTETTVFATVHILDALPGSGPVSIGRAVNGTTLWVLDEQGRHQPIGATGELFIGGRGLADGYLNEPEMTAERFVEAPSVPGKRLYRTGDLVTFRSDGLLYFVGRRDDQVKLRGFRIELGEVINAASRQPGVLQAYAGVIELGTGRSLCLWVRLEDASPDAVRAVHAGLSRQLPAFMVPSVVVPTDEFPLNKNGKVDVAALPTPDFSSESAVAPSSELEQRVAAAWSSVLGVPVEDVHANFFSLGGDSIKAIQVTARLREAGIVVQVPDLLEHQTVRNLAAALGSRDAPEAAPLHDQRPVVGPIDTTPVQADFLELPGAADLVFNQALRVTPVASIPTEELVSAVDALVRAHDLLRVRVRPDGVLIVRDPGEHGLVVHRPAAPALDEEETSLFLAELQRRVDVVRGPAVALATGLGPDGAGFALAIHHLAVDVVSWGVLLGDLERCLTDGVDALPPRTMPFPAWAAALREHATAGGFRHELGHWLRTATLAQRAPKLFGGEPPVRGATHRTMVRIGADDVSGLLVWARDRFGAEPAEAVLALVLRGLATWRGASRVGVTVEGHGREPFGPRQDLSHTVGWFTTTFPLVVDIPDAAGDTVAAVHRAFGRLPGRGLGFGALRRFDRGLADEDAAQLASLAPQVSFNYLGEQDELADTGLRVEHLSGDLTVDPRWPMAHLDVVAHRSQGDLYLDVRLSEAESLDDLAAALHAAVAELSSNPAGRREAGLVASAPVEDHVLDAVLADILGGN